MYVQIGAMYKKILMYQYIYFCLLGFLKSIYFHIRLK